MTDQPNGDSLRGHHAAATQRAVLTAARRVFGRQGYGETSVRELAEEAGVAVQTIYAHFGSKRGVAVALNSRLDEEAGVADAVRAIRESHQPVEVLALLAAMQRRIWERCSDIVRIGRQAAMTGEPALWEEGQGAHRKGMAMIAAHLSGMKALRPGLTPERAGVELAAIGTPDTYETFVGFGGRSFEELEEWLLARYVSVLHPRYTPESPSKG